MYNTLHPSRELVDSYLDFVLEPTITPDEPFLRRWLITRDEFVAAAEALTPEDLAAVRAGIVAKGAIGEAWKSDPRIPIIDGILNPPKPLYLQ